VIDDGTTVGAMYRPRHFAEDRVDVIVELARSASFGHLVVNGRDGLVSTPVPFLIDDGATSVRAHLARPNGLWKLAPCDALLIIAVDDAYISPNWYPSKADHGRVVPTWNYEVVHLHGRLVAHDDAEWTGRQVRDLTDHNEQRLPVPWSVDDAPAGYLGQMVRGIVGIELAIDRIEGKRKLSQNRDARDRRGVVAGLAASGQAGASTVRRAIEVLTDAATDN
jgi:transcriptional regulator